MAKGTASKSDAAKGENIGAVRCDRPQNGAEYLESLLPPRDALLEQMEKFAEENDHPIADPEVAQLMRVMVRTKRPRRVLEVGTNIGYSVVVIGRECDQERPPVVGLTIPASYA